MLLSNMLRLSCTRLPAVGLLIVVGIAMYMEGTASVRVKLSEEAAGEAEQDAQDAVACVKPKCIRLKLSGDDPSRSVQSSSEKAITGHRTPLPQFQQPEHLSAVTVQEKGTNTDLRFLKDWQEKGTNTNCTALWITCYAGETYYLKHIFAVTSGDAQGDKEPEDSDLVAKDMKILFFTAQSSSQQMGQWDGDMLADSLTVTGKAAVRVVIDLKKKPYRWGHKSLCKAAQ